MKDDELFNATLNEISKIAKAQSGGGYSTESDAMCALFLIDKLATLLKAAEFPDNHPAEAIESDTMSG